MSSFLQAAPRCWLDAAEILRQPVPGRHELLWWSTLVQGLPDNPSQMLSQSKKVLEAFTRSSFPLSFTDMHHSLIALPVSSSFFLCVLSQAFPLVKSSLSLYPLLPREPEPMHTPCSVWTQDFALCSCLNSHLQCLITFLPPTQILPTLWTHHTSSMKSSLPTSYMDHRPILVLPDSHIFSGLLLSPVSRMLSIVFSPFSSSNIWGRGIGQIFPY